MHEALGDVAAVASQRVQGVLVLDALGDQVGAQVVRQRHRGPHDGDRACVVSQARHENAVQLQLVDRNLLQAGQ
ncbi:hypothetical protein P863_08105 [Mycobacterium avium subsp. silvaticum ATCC 49884]|nr:hypothetical protein P863_08105 [Mycobacterium avium subsp. silvaticum ATCC 49884]